MRIILVSILAMLFASNFVFGFEQLEIHGLASTGFLKSEKNNYLAETKNGSFEFNEFAVNINKRIKDNIRIGMQIYSYDLGDLGNNEIKLDWAFLDYQKSEKLGLKLGKFKTPIGLYNEIQDYDMLYIPIFLPQSVYTKYLRDTMISIQGAMVYGNFLSNKLGNLRYDIFSGTPEISDKGGMLKYINTTEIIFEKGNFKSYTGTRLKWETPFKGLILAGSAVYFELDFSGKAIASDKSITDVKMGFDKFFWLIWSLEYSYKNLRLSTEYSRMNMDINVETLSGVEIKDLSRIRDGYYTELSYRVNDLMEIATYYSVLYQDVNHKNGGNYLEGYEYYAWQKDLTFSLRFNITDYWAIKVEEHIINGTFLAEPDNYPTHNNAKLYDLTPGCKDENWSMLAVKSTFSF